MSKSVGYEERTRALLEDFANSEGLEVVDVEFVKEAGNWYLRIYIDKDGGVDIYDCEKISKYIDPILDDEDYISQSYTLEVSSPGLTRELKTDRDLQRHLGDYVQIRLYNSIRKSKELIGTLVDYDELYLTLMFEEDDCEKISKTNIVSIKLAIMF